MILTKYDSWLVSEPEEKSLAHDFMGQELYEGDYVYEYDSHLIHEDDITYFAKRNFLKLLEIEEDTEDWEGELLEAGEMAYQDIEEPDYFIINDDWSIEDYCIEHLDYYRLED